MKDLIIMGLCKILLMICMYHAMFTENHIVKIGILIVTGSVFLMDTLLQITLNDVIDLLYDALECSEKLIDDMFNKKK